MPLTPRRRSPFVTMLAAPLLAVAAGSLVVAFPQDVAWGGATGASRPVVVKVVNAEIMVLFATEMPGPGSIDPAIGNLPQLSAYNTYRLLDKRSLPIQMGTSSTYTLANGRVLQVSFVETTPDHGFHVRAAINQPGGNAYLKLLELTAKPNDPFFVGGQSFNGGSILLAITLRP
jgi:hypothetical protein